MSSLPLPRPWWPSASSMRRRLRLVPGPAGHVRLGSVKLSNAGAHQMAERYLEDFAVGQTFGSGRLRVEKERIKTFAAEFDPQPFHLDEDAARGSIFRGLAASGWHTAARAGEPARGASRSCWWRVHPRAGGGTERRGCMYGAAMGPSPRGRGNLGAALGVEVID